MCVWACERVLVSVCACVYTCVYIDACIEHMCMHIHKCKHINQLLTVVEYGMLAKSMSSAFR